MPGPDGKPMHAELKLRDSVLMLGPECPERQGYGAKTLGNSPTTLYFYVEDVDKVASRPLTQVPRSSSRPPTCSGATAQPCWSIPKETSG